VIAAIYARKSTEQNGTDADAKSVARQIENARAFVSSKGWRVETGLVFADDAVSGVATKKLLNRQRLIDQIGDRPSFQVLVMRDASRFSRRDGDEAFGELKRIAQSGVQIWFYQDGTRFEYGTMGANVLGFVRAEMNAEFRRQIAKWTREAMVRKAKAGHVTGGRVFGYDNVRVDGHVERRINQPEAAVVHKIFEMAATGTGFKRIAKALNAERVPCPRAQQGRPNGWASSSIRPVLFRTVYRGVITWGKTKKRDEFGDSRQVKQSADQWMSVDAPHLRIVSEQLWKAAHRRIKAAASVYLRSTGGKLHGRPALGLESKYLLTGFAECSCGSGFMGHSTASGRARKRYYVCTGYHNKGATVCANGLPLWMPEADGAVLAQLRDYVLRPEIVEGAIADAVEALRPHSDTMAVKRRELETQLATIEAELNRLVTAIASGGELSSLLAATKERERQRDHVRQQLTSAIGLSAVSRLDVRKIERDIRARVKDWRGVLDRQTPVARQIVGKLLGDQRLVFTAKKDKTYEFTGRASLGALLQGAVLPLDWRPRRDSNPCFSLERATSWASGRRGREVLAEPKPA
jgi:site-specific DNA recombinase